jgi:hypothetical protein
MQKILVLLYTALMIVATQVALNAQFLYYFPYYTSHYPLFRNPLRGQLIQ